MKTKFKFTKSSIDAIKTPTATECGKSGYILYHDSQQPGLRLKVFPSGAMSFVYAYRNRAGRARKIKLGTYGAITVEQVRDLYRIEAAKIASGGDPISERQKARQAKVLSEILDAYAATFENRNPTTRRVVRDTIKAIKSDLGTMNVDEIRRADIIKARDRYSDRLGFQTVWTAYFKAAINWGRDRGLWPEDRANPLLGLKPAPKRSRKLELTVDEYRRIGAAIDYLKQDGRYDAGKLAAIKLLAITGLRPSEVYRLRPEHIHYEREVIIIPAECTKTGHPRIIQITPEVQAILDEAAIIRAARDHQGYVFPRASNPNRMWYARTWRAITRHAGVKVHLYGLRSSAISATVGDLSLSDVEAMELSGHRNREVWAKHYVVARQDRVKANAEALTSLLHCKLFGAPEMPQPEPTLPNVVQLDQRRRA